MEILLFKVRGLSPLLMHSAAGMKAPDSGTAKRKTIPSPAEEAEAGCYRDEAGDFYMPSEAFRSALVDAGVGRKLGRSSAKKVLAANVFTTANDRAALYDPDSGASLHDYAVDSRRAVVQKQGIVRSRPRLDRWAATFELEYDPDFVSVAVLRDVLALAGRQVGVGDFRPRPPVWSTGRGGRFGRFELLP